MVLRRCPLLVSLVLACSTPEPASPGPAPSDASTNAAPAGSPAPGGVASENAPKAVPSAAPMTAASSAPAESASATAPVSASAGPTGSGAAPEASASAAGATLWPPPLVDDAGEPLPQTRDEPALDSEHFRRFGPALFEAIVKDDPTLAMAFFFPKIAYEQVKAIKKPGRDWKYRLVRLFKRDVHRYHRSLGKYRDDARFVKIEVPVERSKWMKVGKEGNRIGYHRVLRSQLVYEDHKGRTRRLKLTAFISWRGEWYLVHLDGFK